MERKYDVIIIGAGPGGLTAALYLSRAKRNVAIVERLPYGGQTGVLTEIVNYPGYESVSGFELIDNMMKQAASFGSEMIYDEAVSVDVAAKSVTLASGDTLYGSAIIFATGCKAKSLGLRGEDELLGSGVSYCATCDGGFFSGKTVAVTGEGAKAVEAVEYLLPIAQKTYFISRTDAVDGAENIRGEVTALSGKPLDSVTVTTADGEISVNTNALFIYVGLTPQTALLAGKVRRDAKGYIIVNEDMTTSAAGIYAVGDVIVKSLRQIVTAAADGAIAAQAILKNKG